MYKIKVLISTYNGANYIKEQIVSLLKQEKVSVQIFVRDDGSKDGTQAILDEEQKLGHLKWYQGENKGPAMSFMELIERGKKADFYAFCDQDDVWLPHKMSAAVEKLKEIDASRPGLYFSEKYYVDASLNIIKKSQSLDYTYSFAESLFDCNCTGCTMVINKTLRDLLVRSLPDYIEMHDSWIYRFCLACGGAVIHDDNAYIYYRQHENNVIGQNNGKMKRLGRLAMVLSNKKGGERFRTCEELYRFKSHFTLSNIELLSLMINYKSSLADKMRLLFSGYLSNLSLKKKLRAISCIITNKY